MEVGDPQVGEVTRHSSLVFIRSRLNDRLGDHMKDYMDRRVTPPAWGIPRPRKQVLRTCNIPNESC